MACNCLSEMDSKLTAHNTRLVHSISLGVDGPGFLRPVLETEKLNPRKRGRHARVVPTYCPFCGVRYEPAPAEPKPISSQDLMRAGGVDPDAPFAPGPFPKEMRQRADGGGL